MKCRDETLLKMGRLFTHRTLLHLHTYTLTQVQATDYS